MASGKSIIGYYFASLPGLLSRPRVFFRQLPDPCRARYPVLFLTISAAVATAAARISAGPADPPAGSAFFFVNAVGLALVFAALGYVVMRFALGRKIAFSRVFTVYALSSGLVLHAAWMPHFWVFTEPWKWWLVAVGLIHACNLRAGQALVVIGLSVGIWMLVVWSLIPSAAA